MAVAFGDQRRRLDAIELLVGEITSTQIDWNSDSIPLAIRNALERGWSQPFSDALEEGKRKKEAAVDQICSKHYGDFLKSVKELITMKSSAVELKTVVKEMSDEFHSTGSDLITILLELEKFQKDVEKTKKVAESLHVCKEVSMFMCMASDQIAADENYAAMHTVQILQNELRDSVAIKPLVNKLKVWLPATIDKLLAVAKEEAETFLSFSLNSAISVGETILRRRAATLLNSHSYRYVGDSARSRSTADSHFVTLNRQARSEQRQRGELEEEEDSDYESPCTTSSMQYVEAYGDVFLLQNWLRYGDLGDIIPNNFVSPPSSRGVLMTDSISTQLGALHKSLHMHVILGRSDSFAADYRAMRLPVIGNFFKQAEKAMKQKGSLTTVLPTLLASVTGFFLFERIFQHCAVYKNGPFSNIELAALWDELCSKVDQFLSSNLRRLVSPEQVLLIKEELLLFIETTNDAIFHSKNTVISNNNNKLFIVLSNCWDAFENLQVTAATSRCKLELDGCQYQSLYVETEAEYISLIKSFRIQNLMYDEGRNSDLALGSEIVLSSTSVGSSTGTGREEGNANKASSTGNAMFRIHSEGKIDTKGTINSTASTVQRSHGSVGAATAALDAMEENLGSKVPLNANTLSLKPDPHAASRPKQSEDGRRDDQKGVFLPVTYPFSSAIPGILRQVHLLVLRYFIFAVKNPQLDQKGEALCSSVLKVYRFLNSSFKEELERGGSDTPLSKACQISIDAAALSQASDSVWLLVERVLSHLKWGGAEYATHLTAALATSRSGLSKISLQAQDLVFELLSDKVTDLLDSSLIFIDYEPEVLPKEAHDMVGQLVDFLTSTFMWLSHLPSAAREAAHFTCCSRVSSGILQHILSPRVERINVLCIISLDRDAKKLEQFADSCGIAHLRQCFAELKELVRACLHPDLQQMADNVNLRRSLFPRLDPLRLAALLEKLSPTPLCAVSLTSNLPLMEKKFLSTVIKKLKAQSKA